MYNVLIENYCLCVKYFCLPTATSVLYSEEKKSERPTNEIRQKYIGSMYIMFSLYIIYLFQCERNKRNIYLAKKFPI